MLDWAAAGRQVRGRETARVPCGERGKVRPCRGIARWSVELNEARTGVGNDGTSKSARGAEMGSLRSWETWLIGEGGIMMRSKGRSGSRGPGHFLRLPVHSRLRQGEGGSSEGTRYVFRVVPPLSYWRLRFDYVCGHRSFLKLELRRGFG